MANNEDSEIGEIKKDLEKYPVSEIIEMMQQAAGEYEKEKKLEEYKKLKEEEKKILENPILTPDRKKRLDEIDKRIDEIVKELSKPKYIIPQKTIDEKTELTKEIEKLKRREEELRPTNKEEEYKKVYDELKEKREKLNEIERKEKKIEMEKAFEGVFKRMFENDPNSVGNLMNNPPTSKEKLLEEINNEMTKIEKGFKNKEKIKN